MSELLVAQTCIGTDLEAIESSHPLQCEQQAAFVARWGGVEDIRTLKSVQACLPQGADLAARDVFERLRELERRYAAPRLLGADYEEGVAEYDDEIMVVGGGLAIVTAEHATNPFRKRTGLRESADQGTAALAAAVGEDGLAQAHIMVGSQLGNAGVTPNHPIKLQVHAELPEHNGVLSIHSKLPGQAPGLFDRSEVHGYIGLGAYEPRESTVVAAERIMAAAADLGLRVMIGNNTYHPIYAKDPEWQAPGPLCDRLNKVTRDETGRPRMSRLGGASQESMTSWLNRNTENDLVNGAKPIMQLEISNALCVTANDRYVRDPRAHAMGVYLGYLLATEATRIIGGVAA